ncbi:MAG: hypothetical protein EXR41_04460 [Candidatus Methylopumilus sp.]|nr:hypothetical protein [Candidatus Methylopumilus sp.]
METKTILKYAAVVVVVTGSLFVAYNAQDEITDQAGEIKVLQNQIAVLNDTAAQNEELITKNKALEKEVKNLEAKLGTKTKVAAPQKIAKSKSLAKPKMAKKAHKKAKKK